MVYDDAAYDKKPSDCSHGQARGSSQLEEKSGLKRSNISQLRSGSRKTRNIEGLKKLIDELALSPEEYEEIKEAFWISCYGMEEYKFRKEIAQMLGIFKPGLGMEVNANVSISLPKVRVLSNVMDVKFYMHGAILREASKKQGHIKLIMQGGIPELYSDLAAMLRLNEQLTVEHILCLQSPKDDRISAERKNMSFIKEIVPAILAGAGNRYKVYYYYSHILSRFGNEGRMPYALLMEDCVIHISTDFSKAFVTEDMEEIKLYNTLYDEQKQHTSPLFAQLPVGIDRLTYQLENRDDRGTGTYSLMYQPCMGVFPIDYLVDKYVVDCPEIRALIREICMKAQAPKKGVKNTVSYFQKDGIRLLMEKGIFTEIPEEICRPIDEGDRIHLLEILINAIEQRNYETYLINEEAISVVPELSLYAMGEDTAMLFMKEKNNPVCFTFLEKTISWSIYNFIKKLKKSRYTLSRKETLLFLKETLDDYKERRGE